MACSELCNKPPFSAFTMLLYLVFRGRWPDLADGISGVWALGPKLLFHNENSTDHEGRAGLSPGPTRQKGSKSHGKREDMALGLDSTFSQTCWGPLGGPLATFIFWLPSWECPFSLPCLIAQGRGPVSAGNENLTAASPHRVPTSLP
jgi:hypothetical protein